MKNRFLLLILSLFFFSACAGTPAESETNDTSLEDAVYRAIIRQNNGIYLPGEFRGAGYKIVEILEEEEITSVYALTEYVEYGFEDGDFVNISGGNPRVLMRFKRGGEGFELIFYTRLDVLSGLSEEELKELLLPLDDAGKEYLYTDEDLRRVRRQADRQAEKYLKSISRDAKVCPRQNHADASLKNIVTDENLMETLYKDPEISLYPAWTGTVERLEEGERFVYKTALNRRRDEILYTKTNYRTGEIVREITVDIFTGEIIR